MMHNFVYIDQDRIIVMGTSTNKLILDSLRAIMHEGYLYKCSCGLQYTWRQIWNQNICV
jgi:hypothetical protein